MRRVALQPTAWNEIRAVFMDVDGVLTDGTVLAFENGEMVRGMYAKDGFAMQLAARMGLQLVVLSGGNSRGVQRRLEHLGVREIHFSVSYKLHRFLEVCTKLGITPAQTIYIGDDLPDLEPMQHCGLAVAPADGSEDVLAIAHYITRANGGKGCVREVLERLLKAQHKWYTKEALIW
jgi:3-deoxy-D-manno-octulosonate 8-phosphate phosphatase (KDO 8-P phosphatase)